MEQPYRGSKLPRFFKERNQITTYFFHFMNYSLFKITTIFQRTQSNHNILLSFYELFLVQNYHDFSKNAIKSQLPNSSQIEGCRSKLPRFFKERNQITTESISVCEANQFKITTIFQRTQSNHNGNVIDNAVLRVQNYHDFSKNAIKSQQCC